MADIQTVVDDPSWLAHRYVESKDAVQFVPLDRAGHAAVTFITDDHLPADLPRRELSRREAVTAAPAPAPVHFVFHSAFCCSTLIARAFDRPGVSMALKEPLLLNDMVGWRRRGAAGRDVAEATDGALKLLARPFERGEAVVIKPSNIVNGLIPLLMALRPEAKALFLHAPLPVFLTSVAKKGLDGRLWVRELLAGFRRDGLVQRLGFDDEALFGQTDLQVAATGWLAQQALFAELLPKLGGRAASLDSETLLDRPGEAMAALARHFGLAPASEAETAAVFGRDSKSGKRFGRAEREAEYAEAGAAHRDEIDKVAAWAAVVAERAGVPMRLGVDLMF
jgi:hypothetical protein